MIHERFSILFFFFLFIFCSFLLPAQDTLQLKSSLPDSIVSNNHLLKQQVMLQDSFRDLAVYKNHYLKPTALIIPGTFLIYSGLKPFIKGIPKLDTNIMVDISKRHPNFHTNAESYIMWAPSASVYLLDAFKVKTAHSFTQHLAIDAGSILITGGIGYGMRMISSHINAYKSTKTEFPSGHTANAFRGAEILHQELKKMHPVWSYSGYFVAAGVGVLRMYNQQHYFTEVLAGAALGIISTKLTYWIFTKLKIIN